MIEYDKNQAERINNEFRKGNKKKKQGKDQLVTYEWFQMFHSAAMTVYRLRVCV